jgi:hypothetical protein
MEIVLLVGIIIGLLLYLRRSRMSGLSVSNPSSTSSLRNLYSTGLSEGIDEGDEHDISSYAIKDIPKAGFFSAHERQMEYRRRGKSPSGVIDGVYNDMYRENGSPYSDVDRDWDADA